MHQVIFTRTDLGSSAVSCPGFFMAMRFTHSPGFSSTRGLEPGDFFPGGTIIEGGRRLYNTQISAILQTLPKDDSIIYPKKATPGDFLFSKVVKMTPGVRRFPKHADDRRLFHRAQMSRPVHS